MEFENSWEQKLSKFKLVIQSICDYAVLCYFFHYLKNSLSNTQFVDPLNFSSYWCDGSSIHLLNNSPVSFFPPSE